MPVAILAGGLATRLGALTARLPKALVPVGGRPFVEHQLRYLRGQGVERVVLCAGHLGEQIQACCGRGERFGLQVEYSFDGQRALGTGGAIRKALPLLGEEFFVMYGDSWLPTDFAAVYGAFRAANTDSLMTVFHNRDRWDRSNVWFEGGRVLAYDKTRRLPQMEHIDYGLSVFRAAAFAGVPRWQRCDLGELVAQRLPAGFEVRERFYEMGSVAGLGELRRVLQ